MRQTERLGASELCGGHEVATYEGDGHGDAGDVAGDTQGPYRNAPILCARSDLMQESCAGVVGTHAQCAACARPESVRARRRFRFGSDTPELSRLDVAAHR